MGLTELELDKLILGLSLLCGLQDGYPPILAGNCGPELQEPIPQRLDDLYKKLPKWFHLATVQRAYIYIARGILLSDISIFMNWRKIFVTKHGNF